MKPILGGLFSAAGRVFVEVTQNKTNNNRHNAKKDQSGFGFMNNCVWLFFTIQKIFVSNQKMHFFQNNLAILSEEITVGIQKQSRKMA